MMEFFEFVGNETLKTRLAGQLSGRGLSHAYILSGPAGSGKHTLARILTAAYLCEVDGRRPCFGCAHCRKVWEGIHPDVIVIGGSGDVSVKQVRALRSDAYIQPNEGHRKVYVFENAQNLNFSSQNVLLKILEEGPEYAAFLFLTDDPSALLLTVRSRAEQLSLSPVTIQQAKAYLTQRFPAVSSDQIQTAAERCQGFLGAAVTELALGETQLPAAQQRAADWLAALNKQQELELCECGVRLEKCSREELLAFLEQAEYMVQRNLLQLTRQETGEWIQSRAGLLSKAQLFQVIQLLKKVRAQCEANVGVGHCIGLLTAACWEAIR